MRESDRRLAMEMAGFEDAAPPFLGEPTIGALDSEELLAPEAWTRSMKFGKPDDIEEEGPVVESSYPLRDGRIARPSSLAVARGCPAPSGSPARTFIRRSSTDRVLCFRSSRAEVTARKHLEQTRSVAPAP